MLPKIDPMTASTSGATATTAKPVPLRQDARTIGLIGLAHGSSHFLCGELGPVSVPFHVLDQASEETKGHAFAFGPGQRGEHPSPARAVVWDVEFKDVGERARSLGNECSHLFGLPGSVTEDVVQEDARNQEWASVLDFVVVAGRRGHGGCDSPGQLTSRLPEIGVVAQDFLDIRLNGLVDLFGRDGVKIELLTCFQASAKRIKLGPALT